ncbi:hypothetical protein [Rubrivivax gelatinosus]|uniref:Uncharacterized protein n=1 Tax=Rubrivivax gelatinosus (strain NBRC 100245 / IL144) TaxID=983917 RepID=I0HRI2_RUBGI|nr:hypothetical protein [Rubrivivax gelatinosus]BAL95619.1 hypothetical protein RGE_22780 [Rubrivivax gelatinosus IL144]
MTTKGRVPNDAMVDLMSGGEEAEALFEAWLAEGPPRQPLPPVQVVVGPPRPEAMPPPGDDEGKPGTASWRDPAAQPPRRPG